jgi:hypothetical protein
MRPAEHSSAGRSSVFTVAYHGNAVNVDSPYAAAELMGPFVSRPVHNRPRVEDDEISSSADADHTSIGHTETLSGKGCHLPHCILQRNDALVADVVP